MGYDKKKKDEKEEELEKKNNIIVIVNVAAAAPFSYCEFERGKFNLKIAFTFTTVEAFKSFRGEVIENHPAVWGGSVCARWKMQYAAKMCKCNICVNIRRMCPGSKVKDYYPIKVWWQRDMNEKIIRQRIYYTYEYTYIYIHVFTWSKLIYDYISGAYCNGKIKWIMQPPPLSVRSQGEDSVGGPLMGLLERKRRYGSQELFVSGIKFFSTTSWFFSFFFFFCPCVFFILGIQSTRSEHELHARYNNVADIIKYSLNSILGAPLITYFA